MIKVTKMSAAIVLLLAAMLANSIPAVAQEPAAPVVGSWDAIKALPSRDQLTVNLKDGTNKKGRLTDVTDTALMLSKGKKISEIRRDEIVQIYRAIPKSRATATGVGAAVGAGLGGITAAFGDGSSGHGASAGAAVGGVLLMGGIGALIGRALARPDERVLIYEMRK